MDASKKLKKIEIEKELTFYERESKRSRNWFFLNLLGMIVTTALALWSVPELITLAYKGFKKLSEKVSVTSDEKAFKSALRLSYLNHLNSFLIFVVFGVGLFWVLFRFRKWTKYSHRVENLRHELDQLEKD